MQGFRCDTYSHILTGRMEKVYLVFFLLMTMFTERWNYDLNADLKWTCISNFDYLVN